MTRRYLGISMPSSDQVTQLASLIDRAAESGLILQFSSERLALLSSGDDEVHVLSNDRGFVIGDIFRRHVPTKAFGAYKGAQEEVTDILVNGEANEQVWGDYIAIYFDRSQELQLLHAPCGSLNLFFLELEGALLFASESSILLTVARQRRSIRWAGIAESILWDDSCTTETCVHGVREIRCGEVGHWQGSSMSIRPIWNPWRFTEPDQSIWVGAEALDLVRREIFRCIGARRVSETKFALDLSGGLDSSIIAAVCASAGLDLTAINLFNPSTEGDERFFARSVAAHLNMELKEAAPKVDDVDIQNCARPHLPRPYVRAFAQAFDRTSLEIARDLGVSTFLNGGGGDAVFCHLQSSGPVVDRIKSLGRSPGVLKIAFEVAHAAQCNVWDVAAKTGIKLLRGKRYDQKAPADAFVASDCRTLGSPRQSPLPEPRIRPLPGKVEQVQGLYANFYNLNGFARSDSMKGAFPLLSQPLVEACLRVPSWLWLGGGRNRLIARLAIERELPSAVVWRKSKGGLGMLQRETIRRKRMVVLDRLMEGQLAGQGLIDRREIEHELRSDSSYRTDKVMRLMRLCDFEAWCASS